MSRLGSYDPFGHLKHKLWPKEGSRVKLAVWFPPTKSREPYFLLCKWCAKYCWKVLNKGYKFSSNLIPIEGLHVKLWAPKVTGVPIVGISGLPLGSPWTKCHLDVGPVASHIVYYKGEGGDFPQVQAMVSPVNPNSLMAHPNTKSVSTMH
jgi:hypothetical protein